MTNKYVLLSVGVVVGWLTSVVAISVYVFVVQILFRLNRIEQFLATVFAGK